MIEKKFGDERDFQGEGLTRRKKKKDIYIMNERKKERKE
jgi:hypothetical protein